MVQTTIANFIGENCRPNRNEAPRGQVILYKKDGRLHALISPPAEELDEETVKNIRICKAIFDLLSEYNEAVYAVEKNGKYVYVFTSSYSEGLDLQLCVFAYHNYADPERLKAAFPFLTPIGPEMVEKALDTAWGNVSE